MPGTHSAPASVRIVRGVEEASALDPAVDALAPLAARLLASPQRADLLRGMWMGHGVHPLLTDLPIGFFTSASLLDVLGGARSRPAARRLLGWGILTAVPTAVTGLAEWGGMTGQRERRVGVVHAASNGLALSLYVASWLARGRDGGRHATTLALAGGAVASVGGFLGGHLTEARRVSSRHPAFDEDGSTLRTDSPRP